MTSTLRTKRVAVVGQGYVGLPLALSAVSAGYVVFGVERATERLRSLEAARSYVDDVSNAEIESALQSGQYQVLSDVSDLRGIDVVVITVPTPLGADGKPDLRFVLSSVTGLDGVLSPNAVVILESTTFPGTTQDIVGPILEQSAGRRIGSSVHLGFSPERIDPGNRVFNMATTPKLVSGVTPECLNKVRAFYQSLGINTVDVAGTREAEFAKLLENTFRLVNIALVNELAEYGHKRGIDTREAIRAASTKPFGFMPFQPGPGIGGHCIPIDPNYLSWEAEASVGMQLDIVNTAVRVNGKRPDYIAHAVVDRLAADGVQNSALVVVIGLAYKSNVVDIRESPALRVIEVLRAYGIDVLVYDPVVGDSTIGDVHVRSSLTAEELDRCTLGVLLTDHDDNDYAAFADLDIPIIDTRNRLTGRSIVAV
ncbi:nucleotide sugar dehydrogenase [Arthrobacter sp. KFRI-F3372]|uniref:nucleotide sugar dehydrogenase n=1 Tax=Pseudarthrobacter oxydans TaxID=1671 RepID=UPI0027A133D0|nr:nucleotide sugar dehydrogenase [Actinomycetes bacterium ARC8]WHP59821.1 nucleotide sugar dehydrogenase [Arthrobacter sp. KFRI-F3372]